MELQVLICLLLRQGVYCRSSKELTRHGENGLMSSSYFFESDKPKGGVAYSTAAEPEFVNVLRGTGIDSDSKESILPG